MPEQPLGPDAPPVEDPDDGPSKVTGVALYGFSLVVAIGLLVGPIATYIIWRVRRDEPFLDFHGRQAIDIVATAALVGGGLFLLGRVVQRGAQTAGAILQWVAVAVLAAMWLLALVGAIDAGRGRMRSLPASLRLWRRTQPA